MRFIPAIYPVLILMGASGFFLYDIIHDLVEGKDSSFHLLVEACVFIMTSIAMFLEIKRVVRLRRTINMEQDKVYRLTGKLFAIINREFDEWKLTDSEKEIAILLIKGLSMREISELRDVKEKTIRQQATNIYAKSGYSNRYELASHFIQDLINTPVA